MNEKKIRENTKLKLYLISVHYHTEWSVVIEKELLLFFFLFNYIGRRSKGGQVKEPSSGTPYRTIHKNQLDFFLGGQIISDK